MTEKEIAWASEAFGIEIRNSDTDWLGRALTHKSAGPRNFEREEFLGDRVLGLVAAEWLFHEFPDEPEGLLTRRFHQLVNRQSCAAVARRIGVPDMVRLGAQARADGGADSDNILGDVMEALIGAIFLSHGMDVARTIVRNLWRDVPPEGDAPKHPKMALQEWAAARSLGVPAYHMISRDGPQHHPNFTFTVEIESFPPVMAQGHSKQDAETEAARCFLELYGDE